MFKLLITNIIIGSLWGAFMAVILYILTSLPCYFISDYACIIVQSIIGFLLSLPAIGLMWKQTKEINNKSILLLGGPIISISVAFSFYYVMASSLSTSMYEEAPYILFAFVLFYSLLQLAMYYVNKKRN
jgi:hypothetical protein